MSLPPLPDAFGNYAIAGIEEIVGPEPVSWMPQTPAWLVVLLLILALLARLGWRRWRTWQHNRYRSLALEKLAKTGELPAPQRLQTISALLKATALHAYPREEVASLSGEPWVQWLELAAGRTVFSEGSRKLLQCGQYRQAEHADVPALGQLAEESAIWIGCHTGPAHD